MAGWDCLKGLVKEEITQRREEGCNVSNFEKKWEAAGEDETTLMVPL